MDLKMTKERFGGAKLSWLGSRHGVDNARTVTIDRAKLGAPVLAAGVLPAGTPLAKAGAKVAPYTAASGEVFVGFLLTAQSVRAGGGDIVAPMLDHGRVIVAKLPVAFTVPETATSFVFV